ncbi:MAG: hypothetical protein IKZ47_01180 [Clostridia bacterium]|nr:hypothetical protein [Clostridia bacterium]
MEIAAALLAGAAAFFAGFCLGALPPAGPKREAARIITAKKDRIFENFLSYNGDVQP